MKIHYQSDFKLIERNDSGFGMPFKFTYYTGDKTFVASFDGSNYTNCKPNEDGSITVIFNSTKFDTGKLRCKREYYISDPDFPDQTLNLVSDDKTHIILVDGTTDNTVTEDDVAPIFAKGDKGDPFTFNDMTSEQKKEIADISGAGASDTINDITSIL